MKNKKTKIITFSILLIAVIFSVIFAVGAMDGGSTEYWKLIPMEIADYRKDTGYEAPDYDDTGDWLFAGWFDEEGNAVSTDTKSGKYNAKFVPADILGVQAQVNYELYDGDTTNDDTKIYTIEGEEVEKGAGAIRFVTSVDTLDYSKIGFKITRGTGAEEDRANNKVYQQLYATKELGNASSKTDEFKPKELFNKDASTYFKTWTYTKVPSSVYDMDITVTPYWVTLDGTTVKGATSVKCVNMGRQWKYIFVDDTGNDDAGTGTRGCPYKTLNGALAHIKKYGKSSGGEVWILNSLTATSDFTWEEHKIDGKKLDVTITGDKLAAAKSKTVDFSSVTDMGINDAVTFANMILKFQGTSSAMGRVHANGNRFEIAADVTSNNRYTTIHGGAFNGNVTETNVTLLAGRYRAVYGGGCVGNVEKDTHVTLKNTDVYNTETSNDSRVHGGSNRGTVGGNTYVTIGEGFNIGLGSNYKEHHHYSSVYGGAFSGYSSTIATVKGDTYVVIEDDAKVNFIYGGGYNYSKVEGTSHVEFKGGNAQSVYGGSGSISGTNSHTAVVMTGGEVEQVIGGSYATDMTGNANVQVLGGTVTRRIFGGSYNDYELLDGGWQSSKSVFGNTNVTIGSGANIAIVSDDDNSICSVSRYETNFDTETGIMVLNAGQTESMLGFDMSGLGHELYTNYLVKAEEGGSVTSENGVLHITPDTTNDYKYATVTYVTDNNKVLCCTQGEGVFKLPELTDRDNIQEIKVTFSKKEPDVSGFVVKNVIGENATYYNSLDEALEVADKNTKVVVLKDIVVSNPITFTKDITLTSESAVTITRAASLAENMFTVEAGTFSIVGQENAMITIEGNAGVEGSVSARAIRVEDGATCKTEYVMIQNFSIASSGAAIYCDGTLYNTNSKFNNNNASNGSGGAIYATGGSNVTVEQCDFIKNTCSATGGAIYASKEATVTSNNSSFENNAATGNGGAVYCAGTLNDTNSNYQNNTGRNGGAIILINGGQAILTANDAKFSNNKATASGNAIFIQNDGSAANVTGYTFEGENAQTIQVNGALTFNNMAGATLVQGSKGTLYVAGSENIDRVTVTPYQYVVNTVVLTKAEEVEDSIFMSACDAINVTPNGDKEWYINTKGKLMYGEARIGDTYYATLKAAVDAANTDGDIGDAEDIVIHVYKDVEISSKITISKNMVIQNEPGETVSIKYASNSTTYELIQVVKDAKLTIGTNDVNELGKLIIDGTRTLSKTNDKRMIAIDSGAKFILCKNAAIQNANNNQWGCALINKGTSELYGDVKNNTCTGAGGAILQHAGSLIIKDGEYSGNNATSSSNGLGGVIRVYGGTLEIQGGNFTNNSTKYLGGVLYSVAGTTVTVTGGTFSGNTASEGSAFYCLGTLNCTDAKFEGDAEQTIYADEECIFSNVTGATFIQGTEEPIKVAGYTDTNVLKITPYQYVANTSVLTKADGVEDAVFEAACAGITVTPDSYGNQWYIDANGCLNINAEAQIDGKYYETLNEAVDYANTNGGTEETDNIVIIVFKDVTLTETVEITKNIHIQNAAGTEVKLSRGNLTTDMFSVTAGKLSLGSSTENAKLIIDGDSENAVAGRTINTSAHVVIFQNTSLINANSSKDGGAIYVSSGNVEINGATLQGNAGATGGAIRIEKGATITAVNALFEGNRSKSGANGGAISCAGTFNDTNGRFVNNVSGKNGGALIVMSGGSARLVNDNASEGMAIFSGNNCASGSNGSAIFAQGTVTISGYTCVEQTIHVTGTLNYSNLIGVTFTGTGTKNEITQTEE